MARVFCAGRSASLADQVSILSDCGQYWAREARVALRSMGLGVVSVVVIGCLWVSGFNHRGTECTETFFYLCGSVFFVPSLVGWLFRPAVGCRRDARITDGVHRRTWPAV